MVVALGTQSLFIVYLKWRSWGAIAQSARDNPEAQNIEFRVEKNELTTSSNHLFQHVTQDFSLEKWTHMLVIETLER